MLIRSSSKPPEPPQPPQQRPANRPQPVSNDNPWREDSVHIKPARQLPVMPIAFGALGTLGGAIAGGAQGAALGGAIGAGAGFVLKNIARWVTPEGPRLIVGHTGATEAKLWGRGDSKSPYLFAEVDGKETVVKLKAEQGYTGVAGIQGLEPGKDYDCKVSYGATPDAKPEDRKHAETGHFRTSDAQGADFSFLMGSCNNHRFWRREEAWKRMDAVADKVDADFMLHTGDQIYADQPLQTHETGGFRGCYRRAWSSEESRSMLKERANYMILDDHEIGDGFGQRTKMTKLRRGFLFLRGLWGKDENQQKSLALAGMKAYREFQHSHNPHTFGENKLYYTFSQGDAQFFVMDARTERDEEKGEMISREQLQHLTQWLKAHPEKPKFVVSSVPFLVDTAKPNEAMWSSPMFEGQREEILDVIAQNELKGVVFLCGDSHNSFHLEGQLTNDKGASVGVHELGASPVNGFFPRGPKMWKATHDETTAGGTQFHSELDTKNFLGQDKLFNRECSGLMSVHVHDDEVEFAIHRTHVDDAAPYATAKFDLGLKD